MTRTEKFQQRYGMQSRPIDPILERISRFDEEVNGLGAEIARVQSMEAGRPRHKTITEVLREAGIRV